MLISIPHNRLIAYWPASDRSRNIQIRRATRPGTWVYVCFLTVVALTTSYATTSPAVFWGFATLILMESILRGVLTYSPSKWSKDNPFWEHSVFAVMLITAFTWGCFLAVTLGLYDNLSVPSMLLFVCTVGATTGAVTAYSPSLYLLNSYLVLLLGPSFVMEVYLGSSAGYSLALIIALFMVFLVWQGRVLNRNYRRRASVATIVATSRRELELRVAERTAELNHAKEMAEAANRTKSEFLANMSHEIRTPMHGVLGMTELAMDNENPPDTKACLEAIQMSGQSLLQLINDILDFSRIEAKKLVIDKHPFFLTDCIEQCLQGLRLKAEEKSLPIHVRMHPPLSQMIIGDSLRLQQIMTNLLHNAVKFTRSGSITLTAFCETVGGQSYVHFAVADTGCGIPKEKRLEIFQAFSQGDGSTTRQFGGTGLGLTICYQLTQLMNGSIWVEGNESGGSTFNVRLPMELAFSHAQRTSAAGN